MHLHMYVSKQTKTCKLVNFEIHVLLQICHWSVTHFWVWSSNHMSIIINLCALYINSFNFSSPNPHPIANTAWCIRGHTSTFSSFHKWNTYHSSGLLIQWSPIYQQWFSIWHGWTEWHNCWTLYVTNTTINISLLIFSGSDDT